MRKEHLSKKVKVKKAFTSGEVAILFGVCPRTACTMIDRGQIPGYRLPGSRTRYVLLETIREMVKENPDLSFVLTRIDWSSVIDG